jgi:hypothetical protein
MAKNVLKRNKEKINVILEEAQKQLTNAQAIKTLKQLVVSNKIYRLHINRA